MRETETFFNPIGAVICGIANVKYRDLSELRLEVPLAEKKEKQGGGREKWIRCMEVLYAKTKPIL